MKIRKINEEDNPFFELMQYKINLEFISETKNKQLFNKFKKIILSEFRSVSLEIKQEQKIYYIKYILPTNKDEENVSKTYSLNLTEKSNIYLKFLILNETEEKQKYITSYLNSFAHSQNLIPYSRLFIISDKHYENYVYNIKNKIPTAKNEAGVIYTPLKESSFKYIYKHTLMQIIQVLNDLGIKQYEKKKLKDIKKLKKEKIFSLIEKGIIYHDFKFVLYLCNYLENSMNWIPEIIKIKEITGIILFYQDYFANDDMIYSEEIKKFFFEVRDKYRKKKELMQECQCLFRICVYNAYFIEKQEKMEKYVQKLLSTASNTAYEFQILIHLEIMWLYRQINFSRKINLNNYFCISLCLKYFNDDSKIKNYMDIFLNLLTNNYNFPIYDICHKKIQNFEKFQEIHKIFEKNNWKNILAKMEEVDTENGKMKIIEATKKKIRKDIKIKVIKFTQDINFFEYKLKWANIQECFYKNIVNYFRLNQDKMFEIVYNMSCLETLENDINEKKQREIINEINKKSLNKKLNVSLYKLPILIRLIPICSNIKFEINPNDKIPQKKQLFLYNPWKKASNINYFWSKNSYQYVTIDFENVLKIPISINNLIILFSLKELKPESESETISQKESIVNKGKLPKCLPTSITIPPNSKLSASVKILMQDEIIFDIIGIKYDIFNFTTEQYIEPNGNGLFFSYDNILNDDYYSTIITGKNLLHVNLNNIQIYKEIPRLDLIEKNDILNQDILTLFEYQEFLFNFALKNNGKYIIDEIDYFIYIYKKEDYKVCIKEGKIKQKINLGETYNFEYKYFHLSAYYKIEFRFYLKSEIYEKENESCEELINPYIFYFKKLNTENLLNFSLAKIIPRINSNSIEEICKIDKRLPPQYKYTYSFNNKIFSFNASNNRKNKISLEIKDKDNLIKKENIFDEYSRQIEFEINNESKLSDVKIEWQCDSDNNNLKGAMNIGDIFPGIKSNIINENYFEFSLDVNMINKNECGDDLNIFEIKYEVKNNSDLIFNNLKMMCYIYQNITEGEISLNDDLFYEGSLISFIDILKPNDLMNNKIVLYLDKIYDNYCTTFLLINPDNNTVYMSPINKNLK